MTSIDDRLQKARDEVNLVENAANRAVYAISRQQYAKGALETKAAANAASRALYAIDRAMEAPEVPPVVSPPVTPPLKASYGVGAGGWTTGIVIANDGTKMIRTDTFNAYVCAPGITEDWAMQLLPGINCDADDIDIFYGGDPHPWGQPGTYDVALAPSNSAVRWMVCMGYVWVTQDAGKWWTRSSLPQKAGCFPNEPNRMSGKPLVVDPQNPGVCYFGAPDGVHYTADFGANWTTFSAVPTPIAGLRYLIAIDPTSSIIGGRKQGICIFPNGRGLYRTTNGGTSWAPVTGSPTVASHMKFDATGKLHFAGDGGAGNGQYRRFDSSGAWIAPAGVVAKTIAISPHKPGHIYRCGPGGGLDVSLDYGVTWVLGGDSGTANRRTATHIGWQAYTNENYMSNGDMEFDPLVNRLWLAEGMGVWYTDDLPTTYRYTDRTNWIEFSRGIENMVSTLVAFNEAGDLAYACHDRGLFVIPKEKIGKEFVDTHGGSTSFQHGGMLDWVPGKPEMFVGTVFGNRSGDAICTSKTLDKGATWTSNNALRSASGGLGGGNIVAFDANRWLQVQTNRAYPLAGESDKNGIWRTSDAGATWAKCTIGDNNALWFHSAYNHSRRILIADKKQAGVAYAYNIGDVSGSASDLACRGIWKTTDYGATWKRIKSSFIIGFGADAYFGKFTQGWAANEWFWCGADEAPGLWRSTDGMVTWAKVIGADDKFGSHGFGEVFGVAVGRPAPGTSSPIILVAGWRRAGANDPDSATTAKGYGFWISSDNCATWTRYAQYPDGIFDVVLDMAGCPVTYGRFVVAWGGSGLSVVQAR